MLTLGDRFYATTEFNECAVVQSSKAAIPAGCRYPSSMPVLSEAEGDGNSSVHNYLI